MLNHGFASQHPGRLVRRRVCHHRLPAGRSTSPRPIVRRLLGAGWHPDGTGNYIRPDATGISAALPGGPQLCNNCEYFNPAAFSKTPEFAVGNVSRYLPDVSYPTSFNTNALIVKNALPSASGFT